MATDAGSLSWKQKGDEIEAELDRLYPGRNALLLVALCSPARRHEHHGRSCESPGKVPLASGWNGAAVERWRKDEGREAHLEQAARHLAGGGNVGLVVPPGVLVLDADTQQAVAGCAAVYPDAPMQESRPGRAHIVVGVPEDAEINATVKLELAAGITVDLRSAGRSQIVCEPSRHATGSHYRWLLALPADLAELPALAPEHLERVIAPRSRTNGSGAIPRGQRNRDLFEIACAMRGRGESEHAIHAELVRVNADRCRPPLDAEEVERIAASACRYAASAPAASVRVGADLAERLTDLGNARRLVRLHGADLRYRHDAGVWLVWDGRRWATDDTGEVVRRAKATVATIYAEAAKASTDSERVDVARFATRSEARERIAAMIDLARSERGIPVRADELDRDPYALNVLNGTLDLRFGVLRPHRREDLLTKLAPVEYDADARSELWASFLDTAIPDLEARRFAQQAAGYSLLGRTGADVFLVVHGPPRTGKGTFQNALSATLGEYAVTAGLEDFAQRRHGSGSEARPELVRLAGARVVNVYETSRRLRLSASLVKTLTGSDPIQARDLYSKPIEFLPQFTLWIATNHRPRVPDDDGAVWERVRELPFKTVIDEKTRKAEVRAELTDPKASGAAILAWAVAGCRLYLAEGLEPPEVVREATAAYRAEMDPLRDFFAACCLFRDDLWVRSSRLMDVYTTWCKELGERPIPGKELHQRLRARGCEPQPRTEGRGWKGLTVLEPAESMTA